MMRLRALFHWSCRRLASGVVPTWPKEVAAKQAPNRMEVWSKRQRPKDEIMAGPRFTQIDLAAQPNPPAAIEYIKADPIRKVHARQIRCNGDGVLGHPTVFINLVAILTLIQRVYRVGFRQSCQLWLLRQKIPTGTLVSNMFINAAILQK